MQLKPMTTGDDQSSVQGELYIESVLLHDTDLWVDTQIVKMTLIRDTEIVNKITKVTIDAISHTLHYILFLSYHFLKIMRRKCQKTEFPSGHRGFWRPSWIDNG